MTTDAESKVRVMSQWWLVRLDGPEGLRYLTVNGHWSMNLIAAALFDYASAREVDPGDGTALGWPCRADEALRSLSLPVASTETQRGPMGADGRQDDYEILGPVRTMVDMLTGSPMAAALRVGGA